MDLIPKISAVKKIGNHTENIGYFYASVREKAEKGLELSGLALIDLDQHTAYSFTQNDLLVHKETKKTRTYSKH